MSTHRERQPGRRIMEKTARKALLGFDPEEGLAELHFGGVLSEDLYDLPVGWKARPAQVCTV